MKFSFRRSLVAQALIFAFFLTIQACVDHKLGTSDGFECTSQVISYTQDVLPIINTNCAIVGDGGCHNGGNGPNLDWREFTNVQSHALQIKNRITRTPGSSGYMPKIGSLTDHQIQLISCWVDQGAKEN